ncbi:MAG: acetyl-CoA carboxylase biotin carboxyl carrier protein subunit [Chloroflexota bacterium]
MAQARAGKRLRLTVEGADSTVYDLAPGEGTIPTGRAEAVRRVRASNADRAAGRRRYEATIDGWVLAVTVESTSRALLRERAGERSRVMGEHGERVVRAQIPGRVVRLWVAEGDTVEAGQRLLAIEAMKMENEVRAPQAGTIEKVRVSVGRSVELGNELLTVR